MERARRYSPVMAGGVALLLSALSCRSELTGPAPAPTGTVQPVQADARPEPTPDSGGRAQQPEGAAPGAAADVTAYAAARPVLEKHCFRCHTSTGKKAKAKILKHLSFDQYPPSGHHAHETGVVFRRVLLGNKAKGKGPRMPADDRDALTGGDLEKILAWADAFDRTHADHGHHHRAPRPARRP
jgi:hypothetical protein